MVTAHKILSDKELRSLLRLLKNEKEVIVSANTNILTNINPRALRTLRDYFMFTFIALTGLRISEAINLQYSDIFEDYLIIRAEHSKNKKMGTVYFGKKVQQLITELLDIKSRLNFPLDDCPFLSFSRKPQSRSYLHTRFKMWLSNCNLPLHHSIHSLRHTYATLALDKGLSLTFVRDNLRHSNISVTSQYLHLTKENRDKIKEIF